MKYILILILSCFSTSWLLSDSSITRGPNIGEIYYLGSTTTFNQGLYYSLDSGENRTCMDSLSDIASISADLNEGNIYYRAGLGMLYHSDSYGQYGSWEFKTGNVSSINSGRTEGYVFDVIFRHSEDYGNTFLEHSNYGLFGNLNSWSIDVEDSVGYALVRHTNIFDSLWVLISYDNFENFEVQHCFNNYIGTNQLSRGFNEGELYLLRYHHNHGNCLLYSNDFGQNWTLHNTFNCPNLPIQGIVGGRQPGEIYILVEYLQDLSLIKHTYIYHSTDYGLNFEIFHCFDYGPEPKFSYFSAELFDDSDPLTWQFTDQSSGVYIDYWEWDFNGDDIIDSYEQNPIYTFPDSGYFDVSLSIDPGVNDFRHVYYSEMRIHITFSSNASNDLVSNCLINLSSYPNPFNPMTNIIFDIPDNIDFPFLTIYNSRGQVLDSVLLNSKNHSITWDASNYSSGLYLYQIKSKYIESEVKKMLLLK